MTERRSRTRVFDWVEEPMTTPLRPRTAEEALLTVLAHLDDWQNGADAETCLDRVREVIEAEAVAEGEGTDWHYCDFDSRHHRAAEAAPDLRAAANYVVDVWADEDCSGANAMDDAVDRLHRALAADRELTGEEAAAKYAMTIEPSREPGEKG